MVQLMPPLLKTPSSFASFKSRLVLSFWYRLMQVVLEKRPLNGCSSCIVLSDLSMALQMDKERLNSTECVVSLFQILYRLRLLWLA